VVRRSRRFLGGPGWPARELALAETVVGTTFRGSVQTGSYRWVAFDAADPVGYIDCGTCDRWTVCDNGGEADPIVRSVIDRPAASIALAVDPARRGTGIGRAMLRAVRERAEVRDVQLFGAGVEPDNVASVRCFEAAGFVRQSLAPDWEGMLYFIRAR
jgi:ribosomal protein S18 acetylase RimI-like enzyme